MRKNPYRAICSEGKRKQIYLGSYVSAEEAFQAYKKFKENIIKQVANKYKDTIPDNLYQAMINYEVEITD